jgi:hypothetical protein
MRVDTVARNVGRRIGLLLAAAGILALVLTPGALAAAPQYELYVSSGASTRGPLNYTYAWAENVPGNPPLALSILRSGSVVASQVGAGYAELTQAPSPGDTLVLQDPVGTTVASMVYDGLPSIDPSVCVGASGMSGQRTGAAAVTAGAYLATGAGPYAEGSGNLTAQISTLSGSSYAGSFATPLTSAHTVWANEALQSSAPGGGLFDYNSTTSRPAGGCPAPPPPPPPPPPVAKVAALTGKILSLTGATLAKLLHSGWTIPLQVSQPGTVTMNLFLEGGRLPAKASKKKHPAMLLARGRAVAKAPGKVILHLRLTASGRRKLKHAKRAHVVLLTTLHGATATLNLGKRKLTLRR